MSDTLFSRIQFNEQGLIPVIAQQFDTGEVLMMAWMNRDAFKETIETGNACYWSRSRQSLWRKGESSGQTQRVKEVILDCDGDTILLRVDQAGVACHTGRRSCFFNSWEDGEWKENQAPKIDPSTLYPKS